MINKISMLKLTLQGLGVSKKTLSAVSTVAERFLGSKGYSIDDAVAGGPARDTIVSMLLPYTEDERAPVTAALVAGFLKEVDPEVTLAPALATLTNLPILSLAGDYKDIQEFIRDGIIPSVREYLLSHAGYCEHCYGKCLHDEHGHFCLTCGNTPNVN